MREEDEMEIDLVQLLLLCVRKWKIVCITAIVLACLLAGVKCIKGIGDIRSGSALEKEANAETTLEQYELSKEVYEGQIQKFKDEVARNDIYEQNSILINLDPNNYYSAFVTYYIDTDYKVMPDKTYQDIDHSGDVLSSYVYFLQSDQCMSYVKDKTQESIDLKYLSELISVTRDGHLLNIEVVGDTADRATNIINALGDAIASYKKEVDNKVYAHSIELIEYSKAADTSRSGSLDATANNSYVVNKQKAFNDRKDSINNSIVSTYDKLNKLVEPSESGSSENSMKSVAKSGIKFGIIGAVLGAFAAMGCIVFKAIFESKLINAGELSEVYGLLVLGDYKSKKKSSKFEDTLYKMSYGNATPSKEDFMKVFAANVKTFIKSAADKNIDAISLVGAVPTADINDMVQSVNRLNGDNVLEAAGDVLTDAGAINSIKDRKYMIIAVDRNTSNNELRAQIIKLQNLNKEVIGAVLFD